MNHIKLFEEMDRSVVDPFDEEEWGEEDDTFAYEGKWLIYKERVTWNNDIRRIWIGEIGKKYEICSYKRFKGSVFTELYAFNTEPLTEREIKRIENNKLQLQLKYNPIKRHNYYKNRKSIVDNTPLRYTLTEAKDILNIDDKDIIFGDQRYMRGIKKTYSFR